MDGINSENGYSRIVEYCHREDTQCICSVDCLAKNANANTQPMYHVLPRDALNDTSIRPLYCHHSVLDVLLTRMRFWRRRNQIVREPQINDQRSSGLKKKGTVFPAIEVRSRFKYTLQSSPLESSSCIRTPCNQDPPSFRPATTFLTALGERPRGDPRSNRL